MRTPTKFVDHLTDQQKSQLKIIMKSDAPQRKRMRAHAVLLSDKRFSIDQITRIYEVDRDRVSLWLQWWAEKGVAGLEDEPRSGRPPKLSVAEREQAVLIVTEEPRQVRRAVSEVATRLAKKSRPGR